MKDLEKHSHETLTHPNCLRTGKCQETEGFNGTPHEGLDMCEDGCVWYRPAKQIKEIKVTDTELQWMLGSICWFFGFAMGVFFMIALDMYFS